MEKLYDILWAGLGGFLGAALRYSINLIIPVNYNSRFPFGTFLANIIGCFVLGVVTEFALKNTSFRPDVYIFLTIGLCGGFTTFSTFVYEGFFFLKQGNLPVFLLYGTASFVTGFLSLYGGMILSRNYF